jgi:ribonucleoside-diphosphate reductase alpha chain
MELHLSDNALKVLQRRYLSKDENGKVVETPPQLFMRVAQAIAGAERLYGRDKEAAEKLADDFYAAMTDLSFMPNSPALMNAGKELGQLSACFTLPIEDSMESIFETLKVTSLIHKCLVPEVKVMTKRGLLELDKVCPQDQILTDEGFFSVEALHNNGRQVVYELVTERGYSIKGTAEHKLLVVDESGGYIWRNIKDIKKADWVILKPGHWFGGKTTLPEYQFREKPYLNSGCFKPQKIKIPVEITPELAELIGIYIGDGANHRDGIRFSISEKDDADIIKRIEEISLKVFAKPPVICRAKRKGSVEIAILSVIVKQWFKELGIAKFSSRKAEVPKVVLESTEENICAFLRGLFSTDGCVRKSGHITLSTASAVLGEQLQTILLYLGIPTHRKYYSITDSYQVSICSKIGFVNFKEKIGFLNKRKQERLDRITPSMIFLRGETIPNQRDRLREWLWSLPSAKRQSVISKYERIIYNGIQKQELTKQAVVAVIDKDEERPLFFEELVKEDYFFARVARIRNIGVRQVYDLTVPIKHAYLANGFISKNSGGGTGFSFSRLRAKNSVVFSTGGIASGPVSFMKVYDAATDAVKQGGSRRGANMGILRVDHPDILEFICCKENDREINNFNISVAITDDFMQKLSRGEDYDLIDPRTKKAVQRINTKTVFDLIVKQAYKNGEPGIIFIDRINQYNPTPKLGAIESTNPCGEQPILPYESCDLGSINLERMVKSHNGRAEIDWDKLRRITRLAVHFLDNLIDVNKFPLAQIEKATKATRKIGLGVMGWASMLIRLRIPYNSDEAVALAERVMSFILQEAEKRSLELGKEKGVFPAFKGSIYDRKDNPARLRNATLTTIAPTGTISIIAGPCSSGIEPLFAVSYYRKVMDNDKLVEVDPLFEAIARERGFYSRELMEKIAEKPSLQEIKEIPEDVRRVFVTAHDISPEWHVRMQAAFQKYVHNATSKTINFPHEAIVDDVKKAYLLAYELGCKGITIYRDKSREEQVLNVGSQEKPPQKELAAKKEISPRPRPEVIIGTTTKVATGCGNLYVTINVDENGMPFELFTQMGKAGGCAASQLEAIGRLVSLSFRAGVEVKSIIEQLRNIRCPSPSWEKGQRIFSCADAIARVIEKRLLTDPAAKMALEAAPLAMKHSHEDAVTPAEDGRGADIVGVCPDCGGALRHEEGCQKCHACGYSKC